MFYWRFHFDNETPVNCSFTQWKWTYILDFGPWGWSAFNMGFVRKWPSRIKSNEFFRNQAGGQQFSVGSIKFWIYERAATPAQLWHSEKFVGGTLMSPGWHGSFWDADPCVVQLEDPNWGANIFSHMMPSLNGVSFFRTRCRSCTTWWDGFEGKKKKLSAHVACAMKTPKMTSCSPSNFEGDGLHLNLLKKNPKFLGVAHLSFK